MSRPPCPPCTPSDICACKGIQLWRGPTLSVWQRMCTPPRAPAPAPSASKGACLQTEPALPVDRPGRPTPCRVELLDISTLFGEDEAAVLCT